jgi:uncharacterized RDD family membrane protein YckC
MHSSAARPAIETYPLREATAPDLASLRRPELLAEPIPGEHTPERPAYQPSLFRDPSKVIPIPTLSPVRADSSNRRPRSSSHRTARRGPKDQANLDFQVVSPAVAQPEQRIYCDAPVASTAHRLMAGAIDLALAFVALGVFLTIFLIGGGSIAWSKQTLPLLGAVFAVFYLFYQLLFVLGSGDTLGVRWTQMRLVDFDGRRPNREQRAQRMAAELLSVFAIGLGLVWSLVDEESLTWHDHISKTFPTPDLDALR